MFILLIFKYFCISVNSDVDHKKSPLAICLGAFILNISDGFRPSSTYPTLAYH
ncbi:hypothetical protein BGP_2206 [Beggiatoa sp. PS]|nr:hypothetical protein BGP_2206 [Beggiatoa sp. PS]